MCACAGVRVRVCVCVYVRASGLETSKADANWWILASTACSHSLFSGCVGATASATVLG